MTLLELHGLAHFAPSNGFIRGHDWSRRHNTYSLENPESFKGCIQIILPFRVRYHPCKLLLANRLTCICMVHFSDLFSPVYPDHCSPPWRTKSPPGVSDSTNHFFLRVNQMIVICPKQHINPPPSGQLRKWYVLQMAPQALFLDPNAISSFHPTTNLSEVCASILVCTPPSTLSNLMLNIIEGKLTCWLLVTFTVINYFSPLTPSSSTTSSFTYVASYPHLKKRFTSKRFLPYFRITGTVRSAIFFFL